VGDIFGWLAFLIPLGVGVIALREYRLAKLCFTVSAVLLGGRLVVFLATLQPFEKRTIIAFCLCGLLGIVFVESLRWVERKKTEDVGQKARDNPESSRSSTPVPSSAPSQNPIEMHQPPIERVATFTVMIPFNTAPKFAPIPVDENPDDPLLRTYGDLITLTTNGTIPDAVRETRAEGQINWESTPVSVQDAPAFLSRLLQYYVFLCIDSLERNSLTVSLGAPAQANAAIEPPDAEPYPYDKLFQELSQNVFFRPFLYKPPQNEFLWKRKPVSMPKGTEIGFSLIQPERYAVCFQRPGYFKATFSVETTKLGTGPGQVPKNFKTSLVSTTMIFVFLVKMHYSIEHPNDDEFNPSVYSQWLDSLYDGLKKRLAAD
jgi:hypothetical protein